MGELVGPIEISLEDSLKNLYKQKNIVTIEATLRQHTPWWGGDYETKTIHVTTGTNGLQPKYPYITPLTEETLKGALRWVLRAAIISAAYEEYGVHLSLEEADEIASLIMGGSTGNKSQKSLIKIHIKDNNNDKKQEATEKIIEFFNEIDKIVEEKIINKLLEKIRIIDPNASIKKGLLINEIISYIYTKIEFHEDNSYINLEKLINKIFKSIINASNRGKLEEINNKKGEIIKYLRDDINQAELLIIEFVRSNNCFMALTALMATPYVRLHTLGVNNLEDLVSKIPVPPECFENDPWKVDVIIEIDKTDILLEENENCRNLIVNIPKIIWLLLIITPMLIGLGKGSSRGFGRWIPENLRLPLNNERNTLSLENNYNIPYNDKDNIEDLASKMSSYMEKLIDAVKPLIKCQLDHSEYNQNEKYIFISPGLSPNNIIVGVNSDRHELILQLIDSFFDMNSRHNVLLISLNINKHPLPVHPRFLKPLDDRNIDACSENYSYLSSGRGWSPKNTSDIINVLSHATLKLTWKMACNVPINGKGWPFHTWILGLPRHQVLKGRGNSERSTMIGYIIKDENKWRRRSPIHIIPWNRGVILAVFITYSDHIKKLNKIILKSKIKGNRYQNIKTIKVLDIIKNNIDYNKKSDLCCNGSYKLSGIALPICGDNDSFEEIFNKIKEKINNFGSCLNVINNDLCSCKSVVLSSDNCSIEFASIILIFISSILFIMNAIDGLFVCGV